MPTIDFTQVKGIHIDSATVLCWPCFTKDPEWDKHFNSGDLIYTDEKALYVCDKCKKKL